MRIGTTKTKGTDGSNLFLYIRDRPLFIFSEYIVTGNIIFLWSQRFLNINGGGQ